MDTTDAMPLPPGRPATLANWRTAPFNRWAFHHVREIIPSAAIPRGERTWTLPRAPRRLDRITFQDRHGETRALERVLDDSFTDAFIVLERGRVIDERYRAGMRPHDPHILMSVSKSLTAALAGVLADRGVLDPAAAVTDYVPEAAGSAYEGARVQQLLDMRIGVDFDEDYDATEGVMIDYRAATGWNPPAGAGAPSHLHDFVTSLRAAGDHGGPFKYVSPNTDLLGWILERASGERFADLMSREIWAPMGAEFDAYVTVDRLGAPRTAGGICVTLRDLARIGQTMLGHGLGDGRALLPQAWVADTTGGGDADAWRRGSFAHLLPGGRYRNKWYQVGDELGAFLGIGIHGQFLYVAPGADVVVAHFGSHPRPLDEASITLLIDTFGGVARALAG